MAGGGKSSGVPARSPDQRLEALRKANMIRAGRSQLKKDLAAGRVQIVDILARPPAFAETERVSALLLAVPRLRERACLPVARQGPDQRLEAAGRAQ